MRMRIAVRMLGFGIVFMNAGVVLAQQDYPVKTIRMYTAGIGGGNDFLARLVAPGVASALGQQIIIENRGGAVSIPAEAVNKSPPDGYTLLLIASNLWISPFLEKQPYDPVRDFAPITLVASSPNILVVHPSLPVKSVRDLIALAKARPGALSYSTGPIGASSHLAPELFKSMTGVNMVRIPYKNSATEMSDLLGGQVQLSFGTAASVSSYISAGRLRAVAVGSPRPTPLAPGLPTIAESGVPGYESASTYGIFAPAKTPPAIVGRLHQEAVRVIHSADIKQKMLGSGVEAIGNTPDEFAIAMKAEMARLGKMIKDAGIKAD